MNRELLLLGVGILVLACAGMLLMAKSWEASAQGIEADGPKSILDLQPFRQVTSNKIKSNAGTLGTASLVNLDPAVNSWYLLEVDWHDGSQSSYHLENPEPRSERLFLDPKYPSGILISQGNTQHHCNLFESRANGPLDQA